MRQNRGHNLARIFLGQQLVPVQLWLHRHSQRLGAAQRAHRRARSRSGAASESSSRPTQPLTRCKLAPRTLLRALMRGVFQLQPGTGKGRIAGRSGYRLAKPAWTKPLIYSAGSRWLLGRLQAIRECRIHEEEVFPIVFFT